MIQNFSRFKWASSTYEFNALNQILIYALIVKCYKKFKEK